MHHIVFQRIIHHIHVATKCLIEIGFGSKLGISNGQLILTLVTPTRDFSFLDYVYLLGEGGVQKFIRLKRVGLKTRN